MSLYKKTLPSVFCLPSGPWGRYVSASDENKKQKQKKEKREDVLEMTKFEMNEIKWQQRNHACSGSASGCLVFVYSQNTGQFTVSFLSPEELQMALYKVKDQQLYSELLIVS